MMTGQAIRSKSNQISSKLDFKKLAAIDKELDKPFTKVESKVTHSNGFIT